MPEAEYVKESHYLWSCGSCMVIVQEDRIMKQGATLREQRSLTCQHVETGQCAALFFTLWVLR